MFKKRKRTLWKIGRLGIHWNISAPNTVWWHNDGRGEASCRTDELVSIQRLYFRSINKYAYRLIIGRFIMDGFWYDV